MANNHAEREESEIGRLDELGQSRKKQGNPNSENNTVAPQQLQNYQACNFQPCDRLWK